MIIYFTGTGNSKYLARILSEKLDDETVDAANLIRKGEHPAFDCGKPYVFVCPVYAWRIPKLFQKWISSCVFEGSPKAYFVVSCGDSIGGAARYAKRFAAQMGFAYMGTAQVVMPENYIAIFQAPSPDEDGAILDKAAKRTDGLCEKIARQQPLEEEKVTFVGRLCSDVVNPLFYTFTVSARKFAATDACVSCGKCAQNCMLNNVTIQDGKPVWGKDCTHCMACISRCPTEAIEYGRHTRGLRRYVCPKE